MTHSTQPHWRPDTVAVAAGRDHTPGAALSPPVVFAATYHHRDGQAVYGRDGNPTWAAFEDVLGRLEGGVAVAFGSGLAAIAAVIEGLPAGARVLVQPDGYAGTRNLLDDLATRNRLRAERVDPTDPDALAAALPGADLMLVESPTNPLLRIVDLSAVCELAGRHGVPVVVDNTFATPLLQRPFEHGAAVVVHSATKYLGGHSDLLMGAAVARDEAGAAELRLRRTLHGAVPGVMEAYLAVRGMRTLGVRLDRAQASAGELASRLAAHPGVDRVHYPGLAGDPGHALAKRQMAGFGAMVAVDFGSAERADGVLAGCGLIVSATSLGGVETKAERRARLLGETGTPPGLVRVSVGIENIEDIWADLSGAIAAADGVSSR